MKKALLIVAMLLLVSPVMASVSITATVEGTHYSDAFDVNRSATIRIGYTGNINVRAFALDINIDSGCNFWNIRDFNVGENNYPNKPNGYGIFPGRFRQFVSPTNYNWSDGNYNPTPPYADPGTTNTGIGFGEIIAELGYLGATDANKPAQSGTLFRVDVNAYAFQGTAHLTISPDAMRGGVVSADSCSTTTATNLPTEVDVCLPFICITPTNEVGQTTATALAAWGPAPGQGFTNIVGVGVVNCAKLGLVITNDQNCISSTTQLNYTYGIQATVPNEVNVLLATAETAITNAGLTYSVQTACSATIPNGNVISTSPVAGTQTCATVVITESNGVCVTDCFPSSDPNYSTWVSLGKPACWCFPRQCHGDADGLEQGNSKNGYYYVGENDLSVLLAGYKVLEPPKGLGIATITSNGVKGICADFAHDQQGNSKNGYYRVGENDLAVLLKYYKVLESPKGVGVPADCP